jgi:S-adenosylmethionine decarboxylase
MRVNVGTEWVVDASGCRAELLRDRAALEGLLRRAVHELGLTVVGDGAWHEFPPPGGVTGMLLLTESHLVCHTFPEHGLATFNLYCCRPRPSWPWATRLGEALGATDVRVTRIDRGAPAEHAEGTAG